MMLMSVLKCLAYEYCCKICKDKSLDGRNQQLQHKHEYGEGHRYRHKAYTRYLAQCTENKDHRDNAQDNDVACKHVREKTYGKRYRLNEQRNDLDRHQQELDTQWHARRIEQVTPEMFVGPYDHNNK